MLGKLNRLAEMHEDAKTLIEDYKETIEILRMECPELVKTYKIKKELTKQKMDRIESLFYQELNNIRL